MTQRTPPEPYVHPDTARIAAGLRERFGIPVWWGRHTQRWWAMTTDGAQSRLIEAGNPQELAEAIVRARPPNSSTPSGRSIPTAAKSRSPSR